MISKTVDALNRMLKILQEMSQIHSYFYAYIFFNVLYNIKKKVHKIGNIMFSDVVKFIWLEVKALSPN